MAKAVTMHAGKPSTKSKSKTPPPPAKTDSSNIEKLLVEANTPGTPAYARMEKSRRSWKKRTKPLRDAIARSQRMTAKDMTLIVNT